jgi:hypothetical protein
LAYAAVALLLGAMVIAAGCVPALRATEVDRAVALARE